MKKIGLIIICIILIVTGCSGKGTNIIEENVLEGTVKEVSEDGFLLEENNENASLYWVYITEDTVFLENVSKDFAVGNTVKVEHTGEIMESYPMQVYAKTIIENEQ